MSRTEGAGVKDRSGAATAGEPVATGELLRASRPVPARQGEPLPQRVYASALELAADIFGSAKHLPKRTCLGCGGGTYLLADGRRVWTECGPRGVRIYGLREFGPLDVREDRPQAFTWHQVAAAVPAQDGLGL